MCKVCSKCKTEKNFEFFSKNKTRKDGYAPYCKQCQAVANKESNQKHKEDRNAFARSWRQDNREKHLNTLKKYRDKNKPLRASLQMKRKAAKLCRTPSWLSDFDLLKIKCLYQVAAMRTKESGQAWQVDHIVPLQGKTVSGLHVPWNLQVIPALDNLKKNNKFNG
jgi:hypothetical protein